MAQNDRKKHTCTIVGYPPALTHKCEEQEDGTLRFDGVQVNYCLYCGYKAKKQLSVIDEQTILRGT